MRVDPFFSTSLNASLGNLTTQQNSLSEQLASGLSVALPSDDPLAAAQSVQIGSAIASDDAYVQSASGIESRLQVADSALGSAVTQITSAISLAVSGLSGTLSSQEMGTVSTQIASIRDEVVGLANTSYAGSYLFSGTSGSTQPYTNDTSTTPATATYAGDGNQEYTETPAGQQIAVSIPGSAIFSAPGADILGSLNNLVADFSSGTASASAEADMTELSAGLSNLTAQRGVLDSSLSTLQQTGTYTSTAETNLEVAQSSLVATNTATVATELSSSETQQQALLSVMSSSDAGKSLFDYMEQ